MTLEDSEIALRLCGTDEIEKGCSRRIVVAGRPDLAVFRVGEEFFVTDDLCTHASASLSEDGFLEGHFIECSWHAGKFDIRTGAAVALPCIDALRTYRSVIRDGALYVILES